MRNDGFCSPGELSPHELPAAYRFTPATTTWYFSTHGYTSRHTDTPADIHFEGRILGFPHFSRSLLDSQGLAGRIALGIGALELWNGDGYLDALIRNFTVDGRAATFKQGAALSTAFSAFTSLIGLLGVGWSRTRTTATLRLADMTYRLNVPLMTTRYGGTGGNDGTIDLTDKPKPVCIGDRRNILPVCVDPSIPRYQVNWRSVKGTMVVREAGERLIKTAAAPGLGEWQADDANGLFDLGFKPAGAITCDVQGDNGGVGYDPSFYGLLRKLTQELGAGLQDSELDLASFAELAYDVPGAAGWYIGAEDISVLNAFEQVIAGAGLGWGGANRTDQLSVGVIKPPRSVPSFELFEEDIDTLEEVDPPAQFYPPPGRVRLGYNENCTPTETIAADTTNADRAFLTRQFAIAETDNAAVLASYLAQAPAVMIPTLLVDQVFAQQRADAIADLLAPSDGRARRFYKVTTGRYRGQMELGYTGRLWHADIDGAAAAASGWLGVVVAWDEADRLTVVMCG